MQNALDFRMAAEAASSNVTAIKTMPDQWMVHNTAKDGSICSKLCAALYARSGDHVRMELQRSNCLMTHSDLKPPCCRGTR